MLRHIALILTLLTAAMTLRGAEADTTIYLVNIYPGGEIYELEGHSAILVDIRGQRPMSYNYGVFDFAAPNFVYRFVSGETDYRAVEWPWDAFVAEYARQGRRVMLHQLNFDSAEKARLIERLKDNVKPENAVYRYKYVKDNCATRPLRAVELAAGDTILLGPAPFEANSGIQPTFRNIMRHYHRNYPWYQFGIDIALGSGIDYRLNRREMAFAPAELDAMLPAAKVGDKPLVTMSIPYIDVAPDNAVSGPTPWYATPMAVACLIFVTALYLTIRDRRRRRVTRWFDAVLFGVVGLTGCVVTFLVFISVHEATSPNWLLMWLNPAALLVPALIYIKKAKMVVVCYQIVNFALLIALLALWGFLSQSANAAFLPIILAELLRSVSYILHNRR